MKTELKQKELWVKFENHLLNQAVTKLRLAKLRLMFVTVERGLNYKSFEKVNRSDIENFINKLNRNEFLKLDKKKYSGTTKADIKKFLRQFWKWFKGNNEHYPKEVNWIVTKINKDEKPNKKPILSIKEITKFANNFSKIEHRALTLLLFDSGFRIGEMFSVKKKDLVWEEPEHEEEEPCFWIKCNTSKTIPRTIPIPLFTEDIQAFVNSSYFKSLNDDDFIFTFSRTAITHAFDRASIRLFGVDEKTKKLKKKICPHALRHSSATYYSKAYDGNMNQIAQRFGWTLSSKELATYIRQSGAYQKQGLKKIFSNELMKLKKNNIKHEKRIEKLEKQLILLLKKKK